MRTGAIALGVAAMAATFAPPPAPATSGAWALLTNEQAASVAQIVAAKLDDYARNRETKTQAEKTRDSAPKDQLEDFARQDRKDLRADEQRFRDGGPDALTKESLAERRARRKNLRELLAELNAPKDSALQKYSKEYAEMLYQAFLKDPKKFADLAGEISGGEYGKVSQTMKAAGAAILTKAVSEALATYGFENSKQIWDGFTGNIEDLQDVGSSLLRGDWDKFRTSLKALGYKKAQAATEQAVATTIGFAFGPLGEKAGSAYVQLIKAEAEFLTWSKQYLDRRQTQPCIDRYIATYQRVGGPGAQDVAYDEFKQCSEERGRFIGFAKLEEYIVAAGLNPDTIYRQMAEDLRLGNARNVQDWLDQLIESRKRAVEEQWQKEFGRWSTQLADMSRTLNQATGILINGIIEDVIGEARLAELEAAAAKALLDTFKDMQLLRRAAGGVTGACSAFEQAKVQAAAALQAGKAEEEEAAALDAKVKGFAGCTADATAAASLKRLFERAQKVSLDFDRERKNAESEVDAACKAAESVATKTSQDEARKALDAANARAAAARTAGEAATAAFTELTDLAKRAGEVKLGGDQGARDQLAQWALAADTNVRVRDALATQLKEAQARMAAAVRTAQGLEGFAQDRAKLITPVLAPHRGSTLRAQILRAEDEVTQLLGDIALCRSTITGAFTSGDGDSPSWRVQTVPSLSGSELQRTIAAARARCPDAPGEDPAATARAIADLASRADPEAAIVALGKATYERCIAQAVVAFDNVRAAANAVLTLQAPIVDDVKNWAGTWQMASGSGSMQLYDGEYIVKGTYSWTPPPANVGPQGFSISLSAACQTGPKQGGLATGTGISVEGFDIVTSAADRTPVPSDKANAPVNCPPAGSASGSVTVYLMPRANYYEGEVAKIKIGAFWGPGVTYRYVAGKPKP